MGKALRYANQQWRNGSKYWTMKTPNWIIS